MRFALITVSLVLASFSMALDRVHPSPSGWLCRHGFCRSDQAFAVISSPDTNAMNFASLINEDPANPFVWCAYGEYLALRGESEKAGAAFDTAIALGPGMPPILMRAANFDFTHDRLDHGFVLARRILNETEAFDEILFSYFSHSGLAPSTMLRAAMPISRRPAQSWLTWVYSNGSNQDLQQTWSWMKQNGLVDQESAVGLAWALWKRQSFHDAQEFWATWLDSARDDYLRPQLLANRRFEHALNGSPFDWTLAASPSVRISRDPGLEIDFSGTENLNSSQIRQYTAANAGRYRFSAKIQADGLSTDQGPFVHIFDVEDSARFSVQTPQIKGTVAKSLITLEFAVPEGTRALGIQLERHESQKFDNKIQGKLHIYEVSLIREP